jgi:hypothetical protein
MGQNPRERRKERKAAPRTHPLCAEAQADGVPCYEVGRACETCERARPVKQGGSGK